MTRYINPVPQYSDDAGAPLVSGQLWFYESGTDTPKTTYADVNLSIPNTNPVDLTGDGRVPNIFFDGTARVKLTYTDLSGGVPAEVQLWDRDPVSSSENGAAFDEWVPSVIYNQNDIVEGSDGKFYLSFTDGNLNNDPTTSPEFWQEIEFINVWNEFVNYSLGAIVKASDNNFYKSLIDDNLNNDPVSSPAEWGPPILVDLSSPGPIGDGNPDTAVFTSVELAAISGIIATDSSIVDHVVFGPFQGTVNWIPRTDAPATEKMLATISHSGVAATDATWNLYDLSAPDFTDLVPLATIIFPSVTAVNGMAAASWYCALATDDGMRIISPITGVWAEQLEGYPKSLTSVTVPKLPDNAVSAVAAGFALTPRNDYATKGDLPEFGLGFSAGTDTVGVYKDDGQFFSTNTAPGAVSLVGIAGGHLYYTSANNRLEQAGLLIDQIIADDWASHQMTNAAAYPFGFASPSSVSVSGYGIAAGSASGLQYSLA